MASGNRLTDLIQALTRKGGRFLSLGPFVPEAGSKSIEAWCERLLSGAGEASGTAIAGIILEYWRRLGDDGRAEFLVMLKTRFGVDEERLESSIRAYLNDRDGLTAARLHQAAEPRRQDLFRRLNLAPGGVATLVSLRADLLERQARGDKGLEVVDIDLSHLFASWFNRGFLTLQRIDWNAPANKLEKIIRYEAVHEIGGWEDLRSRLQPEDRRCYAFFHPQLPDEPLIFVEVALTKEMPGAIAPLLAKDRAALPASEATHAVFYSISNCQAGLRGISFGNFIIKQVVEELKRELPGLRNFVTLSPVPTFAAWLDSLVPPLSPEEEEVRLLVARKDWVHDEEARERLSSLLPALAARYFLVARDSRQRAVDPVARFHLGNGASLARINCFGDLSAKAAATGLGLMVNYRYELDKVELNHERFVSAGEVAAAPAIRALLSSNRPPWRRRGNHSAAQSQNVRHG